MSGYTNTAFCLLLVFVVAKLSAFVNRVYNCVIFDVETDHFEEILFAQVKTQVNNNFTREQCQFS